MKKTASSFLHGGVFAAALVCMSAQAWEIEKHTDEMTDAIHYAIYTTGTVVNVNGLFNYTPQLQIRIHPVNYTPETDTLRFSADVLVCIEEGLPRRNPQIMIRIDDTEPVTSAWKPSTDRRAVFSPEPLALIDQLKSSTTLRVRYITTLGDIRTTRFATAGIADEMPKVKTLYKLHLKLHPEAAPPASAEESPAQPAAPTADPKLVAQATSAMNDITRALDYAKKPDGTPPRMQTATSLNKPLTAISRAVDKKNAANNAWQKLEGKLAKSKPGSIGRPTPEQLDRAQAYAAKTKTDLTDAIFELRRQARSILQTSDWPTPELSAQAKAISARIPAR